MTQLPSSLNPALFPIPLKQQKTAKAKISATSLAPILHSLKKRHLAKLPSCPKAWGQASGNLRAKKHSLLFWSAPFKRAKFHTTDNCLPLFFHCSFGILFCWRLIQIVKFLYFSWFGRWRRNNSCIFEWLHSEVAHIEETSNYYVILERKIRANALQKISSSIYQLRLSLSLQSIPPTIFEHCVMESCYVIFRPPPPK